MLRSPLSPRSPLSRFVIVSAFILSACGPARIVERAYDGHVVFGRFIAPEGYASFLRGVTASANGDTNGALAAYTEAARIDPNAPEIWTRIGDLRCRINPHDLQADASFARALALDGGAYVRAWAAKATCALARHDLAGARAAALRAVELDPTADGANALLARIAKPEQREATRSMLVALTLTAREPVVAWDALVTWAKANGDVALWARALEQLARVAPTRREEIALAAEELAGLGETSLARGVAAAAAEADERPLGGDHALAARLALDEAIVRGDAGAVRRRATRVRLPVDEAAGRALLRGNPSLAVDLALSMARGDPTAMGARLVLAASGGADVIGAARDANVKGQIASAAAFIAFGGALAHATSAGHAREALSTVSHDPITGGDDLVVRPAVELALRGEIPVDVLPTDGVVELTALRGETPGADMIAPDTRALDVRHEYLWLALTDPTSQRAKELSTRLGGMTADPIVVASSALLQAAAGAATGAVAARGLLARDAGDLLFAAVALRAAEKALDRDLARRASTVLNAFDETFPANVK